jgi:SAM-dependent methyltransferase
MVHATPDIWDGSVLDVGCRRGEFHRILVDHSRKKISYVGVDLYLPATVLANLDRGLPFSDRAFEVVVALDVLEHTDNIHTAFAELCRVSNSFVLILLPNAFEIVSRLKFIRGGPLNGKYGLPTTPPADRHRWIFSLTEAQTFVHHMAARSGFTLMDEMCVVGPRRQQTLGGRLCRAYPNLLCQWYLALLQREKDV